MFVCIRMYVRMYVCMYACIHVYKHTHTQRDRERERTCSHIHTYMRSSNTITLFQVLYCLMVQTKVHAAKVHAACALCHGGSVG